MIPEHDLIVLTRDLPEHGLKAGDVGTLVHVHQGGIAYEVEFMTVLGDTVAVETVRADQLRPVGERDMHHARPMEKRA